MTAAATTTTTNTTTTAAANDNTATTTSSRAGEHSHEDEVCMADDDWPYAPALLEDIPPPLLDDCARTRAHAFIYDKYMGEYFGSPVAGVAKIAMR